MEIEAASVKTCSKCKVEKPFSMFHKSTKKYRDGYNIHCKECRKKEALAYRDSHGELLRQRDKNRYVGSRSTPVVGTYKYKARMMSLYALRKGKIKRLPCEECGNPKTHGHHDDYSKPYDLRFLCARHHRLWHVANGEAKNA